MKLSSTSAANVTTINNKIALNGNTRTIQVDNNPNTTADFAVMAGTISGSAGIIKSGDGLLKLNAADTYTGTTLVSGGVLTLDGINRLSSASVLSRSLASKA